MLDITEEQIDKQENLSLKRLKKLSPKNNWSRHLEGYDFSRPREDLIDLMHWVRSNFSENPDASKCFIHNKIVIDGSFMEYCEKNDVNIETLYLDSVASWKSDASNEHFMAQGVFKISCKGVNFIHAALFHKGNQNEDEVSFFIVVEDKMYTKYISFRNQFDKWLMERDREHLEIHVVGAEGYPYTRDLKWDDLFLPTELKKDIRNSIEGWLNAKEEYEKAKIPWKRGLLLYGEPGCGKSSTIKTIISNYNFKPVTIQNTVHTNDDTITEAFEYAQEQEPGLLYLEDLDTLLNQNISLSHFLNLLDGISTRSGVMVIATANDLSQLKDSVTNRPSRFDRKWEIPMPDKEMAIKYLKHWFSDVKDLNVKEIALLAADNGFSYAYLKELYLTSMFSAVSAGRKKPSKEDIKESISLLLNDRKQSDNLFETTDHRKSMFGIA